MEQVVFNVVHFVVAMVTSVFGIPVIEAVLAGVLVVLNVVSVTLLIIERRQRFDRRSSV